MSPSDRDPDTKPLITLELWQLVLLAVALIALAGRFLLGAGLPHLSKHVLLVLLLLAMLAGLLVVRARKRKGG